MNLKPEKNQLLLSGFWVKYFKICVKYNLFHQCILAFTVYTQKRNQPKPKSKPKTEQTKTKKQTKNGRNQNQKANQKRKEPKPKSKPKTEGTKTKKQTKTKNGTKTSGFRFENFKICVKYHLFHYKHKNTHRWYFEFQVLIGVRWFQVLIGLETIFRSLFVIILFHFIVISRQFS